MRNGPDQVPSRRMDARRAPMATDDADLVTAAVGGDQRAFAEIYDRYADRVFSLCLSLTRDRGLAEDALADTFVAAWQRLDQLRDRAQLRPWLFAIARNRVARLGSRAARQVPVDPTGPVMRDQGVVDDASTDLDGTSAIEREAAVALVWEAAEGLNANERSVLELQVRQGVTGDELASALGVTRHNANVIASRMRQNLERSISSLWLLRYDDGGCETFSAIRSEYEGTLTPLWRKRIARHVDGCDLCETRSRNRALALFGESPASAAPIAARSAVLDAIALGPAGVWASDGRPFRVDGSGFPRSGFRGGRWLALGVLAVVATIVLLVTTTGVIGERSNGGSTASGSAARARSGSSTTTLAPGSTTTVLGDPSSSTTVTAAGPSTTAGRSTSTSSTTAPSAGPVITSVVLTPSSFYVSGTNCTLTPRSAVLVVTATGASLRSGTATIRVGGALLPDLALSGSGAEVKGTLGPLTGTLTIPMTGALTASVTVTDTAGRTSAAWTGGLGSVLGC